MISLFKRGSRSLKAISVFAAIAMAYSSSAQGINSIVSSVASCLFLQVGGDYTDTPVIPDSLPSPLVEPDNRGDFYSSDDLSQIETAAQIQMDQQTAPTPPALSDPAPVDPGDNTALDGRPLASQGVSSSGNPGSSGLGTLTTGSTSTTSTTSTTATTATTATTSTTSTTSTTGTTGSTGTTGTTIIGTGGNGAHAGSSFPWEGMRPGGGSEFGAGAVNTQTGNRLTTVPIVGWKTRGGVPFGLTLYHNNQDSTDIGWGKGWRSTIDFSVTYTGRNLTNNVSTAVVAYPDGRRLVFKYVVGNNSLAGVFYPPTGFYDVLIPFGDAGTIPSGWMLRTKSQMIYTFSAQGKLTSYRDRYGNAVTLSRISSPYTGGSGELRIIAPDGNYIKLNDDVYSVYSQFGRYAGMANTYFNKITAPGNRVWDLHYGVSMVNDIRMSYIQYPTLNGVRPTESFTYGFTDGTTFSCAPMTRETDVLNRQWTQTYDSSNRMLTFTMPVYGNGNSNNPTYNFHYYGSSTEFVQPSGNKVTEYYSNGILSQVKDQAGYYTSFQYDTSYNIIRETDAKGQTSYYTYDAYANVLKVQDPRQYAAGKSDTFTYNTWNDLMTEVDSRGTTTYYNRNSVPGALTSIVDGRGNTVQAYTYNSDGSMATHSSEGATTQIYYNTNYQPSSIVTPDASATITYGTGTLLNRPISITDNRGRSTTYSYDDWGRLTSVHRYDGAIASVAMNTIGYVTSSTDALSRVTTVTRDGIGRVTAVTNPRGDTEYTSFDSDSNMISFTDGRGKVKSYSYTPRSELRTIYFGDGTTEQYKYDGNGNQTQRINGNGQIIQFTYDSSDNLTQITYPDIAASTFTYDYDGRQTTMVDSTGTSSWTYDNANNITQLVTPQGTMQYAYDVWNRRSSMTEGSAVTTYGYANARLTSITKSTDAVATTFSYDSYGRLTTKNDGATMTSYGYDSRDRINSIIHTKTSNGSVLHQESYVFDYVNNLTSKTVNGTTTSYTYDAIDQLKTEVGGGLNNTYNYDANGNRTSKVSSAGTDTYTYDNGDKLLSRSGPSGSYTYTYDNCGRTTQIAGPSGTRTFTWDSDDRMLSASGGGVSSTTYAYNALRTRVSKTTAGSTRTYKRDGVDVDDEILSDSLSTMVPGISVKTGSTTNFLHTDRLSSMKAMSATGTVTDTADYDAFGKVLSRTGSSPTQKGFASGFGYLEDTETGYKLVGRRYYDPETGRFLSRDTTFAGSNYFVYCENNPLKRVDPRGEDWLDDASNFFAGWGDTLTFGGTAWVREKLGVNDVVDTNSGWYHGGEVVGTVHSFLIPEEKVVEIVGGVARVVKGSKAVTRTIEIFREQKAFRKAAILLGKIKEGEQAHHIIPKNLAGEVIKRFGSWFKKKFGYELADWIHTMENCMGWDAKTHGKMWKAYENALRKWLEEHPNATWDQFLKYAKWLTKEMQKAQ